MSALDQQPRHAANAPDHDWDAGLAASIIASHAGQEGAALPILHALQSAFGYVPKQSQAMIAEALNVSRAEIHGVVSFYHDFKTAPQGRHVLKICRAEACQSMGSVALSERFLQQTGVAWGGTTADGGLTIEPVYCLGLCACGPAALLDGEPIARLNDVVLSGIAQAARV